jgi:hypothetical protein
MEPKTHWHYYTDVVGDWYTARRAYFKVEVNSETRSAVRDPIEIGVEEFTNVWQQAIGNTGAKAEGNEESFRLV